MELEQGTPSKLSPRRSLQRQKRTKEYTEDEVKQALENALTSGRDFAQVVRQIFDASQSETCRRAVFEHCIELLNSDQLQNQVAKELVGKLLIEVDSLKSISLMELMDQLIEGVKKGTVSNGRSLELFPKALSVIAAQSTIRCQKDSGGSGEMEGSEHKSHILNSLYSCRWAPSCVLHVANMCREIPMTSEELQFLIEKILRVMKPLPLSELPPLAYQLLVLSTKGHKTLVLDGIQALFNQLDSEILNRENQEGEDVMAVAGSEDELLQTEGTVILHITFALKQDQELGKEFVKNLKVMQSRVSTSSLSSFSIALSLSVARIHRFEDPVFDFLKGVILRSFKDEDRRKATKWMQEVDPDSSDMEKLLLDTVQHSVCGWDHVVKGLVMAGFHLMDSFTPKSLSPSLSSPQHRACLLGSKILFNSYKVHPIIHEEIVSQLINRILVNASSYVSHYIALLSDVVGSTPQVALNSLPQLREAFSYLSLLPPVPAIELLHAILPLVQFSVSVRDCLLLVLRKSLFSRQVEARKIAVGGYLLLLRKFKVLDPVGMGVNASQNSQTFSGSQVQVEVHAPGPSSRAGNEALCLEILGTLKRCLSQQDDVRLSLYEGLYEVFCSNPKLAEPVVDLLIGQFQRHYESDNDIIPPVKLEACIAVSGSEVHRAEPLDRLVQSLQLCVSRFTEWQQQDDSDGGMEGGETPEVVEEAREILQSLAERMVKSEPEDFELDKSADFSSGSSVGKKNRVFARLVMGICEALLEYTFTSGDMSQESCEQALKLYHGYQRVADILQEKTSSAAGTKRGPSASPLSKTEHSNLSLRCVISLLRALFSDAAPNHQQPLTVLRDSHGFVKYVLNITLQKIHQIHDKGTCEGAFLYQKPEKIFRSCCSLARVLFKQMEAVGGQREGGKKEKGKSVQVLCLEGFSQLLQTVHSRYPTKMDAFLSSVNPSIEEGASVSERVHFFIRHFQRSVTGVLNGNIKEWGMKETHTMVSIIGLLASELEMETQQLDQVYEWTHAQCKEQNVDDPQVTKALMTLLLHLTARHKGTVKIFRKLSQDVHYHLGDIDEDIELECRTHFAIVNPRTAASSILGLLYTNIDQTLNDADWLIARLKSESSSNPVEELFGPPSPTLGTQAEKLFSNLCERVMLFVASCSELVQSALPPGTATEGILKTITKLYTVLVNLVKYHIGVYAQLCHVVPTLRKLVEMVGTHLSQQLYALITYTETAQTSAGGEHQQVKGKKGGKGKSKAATAGKASAVVKRQTRSIPSLIFAMEQFEKFLIQLSKRSKVNLMENFKTSTARDFRINGQTLDNILHVNIEEEEEEEEEGCEGEEGVPTAKRLKMN